MTRFQVSISLFFFTFLLIPFFYTTEYSSVVSETEVSNVTEPPSTFCTSAMCSPQREVLLEKDTCTGKNWLASSPPQENSRDPVFELESITGSYNIEKKQGTTLQDSAIKTKTNQKEKQLGKKRGLTCHSSTPWALLKR